MTTCSASTTRTWTTWRPRWTAWAPSSPPELALEELPGCVARESVDALYPLRDLVARQAVPAPADQVIATVLNDDERRDRLPPFRIGDAHHRRVGHGRVRQQDLLHLGRGHVLPSGHDQLLEPPVHPQEPGGV